MGVDIGNVVTAAAINAETTIAPTNGINILHHDIAASLVDHDAVAQEREADAEKERTQEVLAKKKKAIPLYENRLGTPAP